MESNSMFLIVINAMAWGTGAGVIAVIYRTLAHEPILHWWFRFGNRFEKKWFFSPVWGCTKCIAGQLALWSYVTIRILPIIEKYSRISIWTISKVELVTYGASLTFGLLLCISTAILSAIILSLINSLK